MKIVGVGAGPNLLTQEAISAIENAIVIFGSGRAIELAKEHIRCEAHEIADYTLSSLPEDAVILSTGDPMLSGLGKFAKKGDEIIPGHTLTAACLLPPLPRYGVTFRNNSPFARHRAGEKPAHG